MFVFSYICINISYLHVRIRHAFLVYVILHLSDAFHFEESEQFVRKYCSVHFLKTILFLTLPQYNYQNHIYYLTHSLYANFITNPNKIFHTVFFPGQNQIQDCIPNLVWLSFAGTVIYPFLVFLDLDILQISVQKFCKMPVNFGLSDLCTHPVSYESFTR